jgi:hypothetical protein
MPWKTFLKAHWGAIAAADFFSVEVLTRGGLVRYLVLFVIDTQDATRSHRRRHGPCRRDLDGADRSESHRRRGGASPGLRSPHRGPRSALTRRTCRACSRWRGCRSCGCRRAARI